MSQELISELAQLGGAALVDIAFAVGVLPQKDHMRRRAAQKMVAANVWAARNLDSEYRVSTGITFKTDEAGVDYHAAVYAVGTIRDLFAAGYKILRPGCLTLVTECPGGGNAARVRREIGEFQRSS